MIRYFPFLIISSLLHCMMTPLKLSQQMTSRTYFEWRCHQIRKAWRWNESVASWIAQSSVNLCAAQLSLRHHQLSLCVPAHEFTIFNDLNWQRAFNILSLSMGFNMAFWMLWTVSLLFCPWLFVFLWRLYSHWIHSLSLNKASASVWDQIFDHKPDSNTVQYYIDEEVQFNIKACYLKRSFNNVI